MKRNLIRLSLLLLRILGACSSAPNFNDVTLSPDEAFEAYFDALGSTSSTLYSSHYIKQYIIDDKVCFNEYYKDGVYTGNNDGHIMHGSDGLFYFTIKDNTLVLDYAENGVINGSITEHFYTTKDLKDYKSTWKKTSKDYQYRSTSTDLGELILDLDGMGLYAYYYKSLTNKLTIEPNGKKATFECSALLEDNSTYVASFEVYDLGTTTHNVIDTYLSNLPTLTNRVGWKESSIEAMNALSNNALPYPNGSYVSSETTRTIGGIPATFSYLDYRCGDIVSSYRNLLENDGYIYSTATDETGDMIKYGYVRYYYIKHLNAFDSDSGKEIVAVVETHYVPLIQITDQYEKKLYPNGIFSITLYNSLLG